METVCSLPAYNSQLAWDQWNPASSLSLSLLSVAVFNLSAPPVVYEQNLTFNAMISLIAPSGGTSSNIEIDIMERGITATPFGESQETMKICMSPQKFYNTKQNCDQIAYILCHISLFSADFRRNARASYVFQGIERPGCCERTAAYQVRDDNVAEPDEILTISIARSMNSASIPVRFVVQQVNVTIIDNDSEWIDE